MRLVPAPGIYSLPSCDWFLLQADVLTDPTVREFGLQVSDKMLRIQARVLPPPVVQYANRSITPSGGAWNLRGMQLYSAKRLQRWGVVCLLEESRARNPQVGLHTVLPYFVPYFFAAQRICQPCCKV